MGYKNKRMSTTNSIGKRKILEVPMRRWNDGKEEAYPESVENQSRVFKMVEGKTGACKKSQRRSIYTRKNDDFLE